MDRQHTVLTQTKRKPRIQPKPEKLTAWECRKQLCYMPKKIKVSSQIYRVICRHTVSYLASWPWYPDPTQFHNFIVVPTIEYRRSKNKVLHTTQDIKVSIESTLFENIPAPLLQTLTEAIDSATLCLFSVWFYDEAVKHRNQKSSL